MAAVTYTPPEGGTAITVENGKLKVPDTPIIPVIPGDGIGQEVSTAGRRVLEAAVQNAYGGKRELKWLELLAGDAAYKQTGEYLPEATKEAIQKYVVAIKGPLTTPIGGGHKSLNVTLRQELDLFASVRPVRWFDQTPNPMKEPEKLDIVVFRENSEDVYAGIEWAFDSTEAQKVRAFLSEMGAKIREDSGIGVKPISRTGTKRLVRAAIQYALDNGRGSVTFMHKGNIMKYTEGAFRAWGYEVAKEEFGEQTITEQEVKEQHSGAPPKGKVVIKDRIADAMFQELLLHPERYSVIATPNLNGDYLSDAAAAQIGGLGIAPGANINYEKGQALFEATHGTAPDIAGKGVANPTSFILSGAMMLAYLGWKEARELAITGVERAFERRMVTADLAVKMKGAVHKSTNEFADLVIGEIGE